MRSLRSVLSERLLDKGMSMALDSQEMWARYRRAGCRTPSTADLQVMFVIDCASSVAIWVGTKLMPAHLPERRLQDGPPASA